jgi:putative ABC transport system permease protein
VGIYTKDELAGPWTVDRALYTRAGLPAVDFSVFVRTEPGANADEVKAELTKITDDYGFGEVQTRDEYIDAQAAQIDQLVRLVYGLLGLSVFIAAFGIIITLLLSVFERRRELALSRAVGMSKRQVRSMVRWEAVITTLLGTVQGVLVGALLGFAMVLALRDEGLNKFSVPVLTVIAVFVIAFLLGVLAAIIPARRATRTNVVEGISTT